MRTSHSRRSGSAGFTLIEIVIVLTIISILASIAIVNYRDVQNKAEAARMATQLHYIEDAIIEAILDGAEIPDFNGISAANVDQSVLSDYLTSASFSDIPAGYELTVSTEYGSGGSDRSFFLVNIYVELNDGEPEILAELESMFPPHSGYFVSNEMWLQISSRTLALTPDAAG